MSVAARDDDPRDGATANLDGVGGLGAGFTAVVVVRLLTVLNDNLCRWLVIGLGKRAAATSGATEAAVLAVGTVIYVLPFILFAWLAGWLADRFAKRSIVVGGKAAEILIGSATAAVVWWGAASGPVIAGMPAGLWLLLGTIGLFAIQTTILNPSLLGTIPETVPTSKLSAANGIFAMVSLAATLVGMAAGNWLSDATWLSPVGDPDRPLPDWLAAIPGGHALPAAVLLTSVAAVGWLVSLLLPRIPAADPAARFPRNALRATFADLAALMRATRLAGAAAGIVFFWALAAVAQLNVDQYAYESGGTSQGEIVPLLVALVGGIGVGSLIAGRLSRRGIDLGSKVDLGFVPLGGLVMTVACGALALSSSDVFGGEPSATWRLVSPVFWLAVLGIGAGMFDVPLEAYLQEQSPSGRLGSVLASTNLLVFAGMLLASVGYYGLRVPVGPAESAAPLFTARGIFALFGLLAMAATALAVWAAPRASLRIFVGSIVHAIWRFRIRHTERMPLNGPLVVVANHVSWLDGFLLPLASPRPVRMVVYGPNIRGRFLNMLADQWRFILFDPKPKSIQRALRAIQQGLAEGDCIGIFCEGGISRTGQLLGFKRGLEWLLDRVESPILPASIDGMWGSLLSHSEGRYFTKWPRGLRRGVTLTLGSPLPAGTPTPLARLALQELAASAVRRRMAQRRVSLPGCGDPAAALAEAEAFDAACVVRRGDRLLVSLAEGDPLRSTLGDHGQRLLGLPTRRLEPDAAAASLVEALAAERTTIWLARVEQVEAAADHPAVAVAAAEPVCRLLEAVVMPIGSAGELPRARRAAERFREGWGVEPVVAYVAREAGCLVAMNTPPTRSAGNFEVSCKPETLGRVLNGGVVWPEASLRSGLGLPLEAPCNGKATLLISAMLPQPAGGSPQPDHRFLADRLAIDADGFLVPGGAPEA